MIGDIARRALNPRLASLALLALCLIQSQARAQDAYVVHTNSWEMDRGETVRFKVFNPDEPSESWWRGVVFIQVTLFERTGAVIGNSEEIAIAPGESRSVDFNRDDLSAGSLDGRVQVHAEVRYRPFPIVDRTHMQVWPLLIELIDDATGNARLLVSLEPNRTGGTTAVWLTVGFFEVVPPRNPQ